MPAAALPRAASSIRTSNKSVILSLVGFCSFCFPRAGHYSPLAVAEIQHLDCCAFHVSRQTVWNLEFLLWKGVSNCVCKYISQYISQYISEFITERKVMKEENFFKLFYRAKNTCFCKMFLLGPCQLLGGLPGSRRAGEWVNMQNLNLSSAMFLLKGRILSNWTDV